MNKPWNKNIRRIYKNPDFTFDYSHPPLAEGMKDILKANKKKFDPDHKDIRKALHKIAVATDESPEDVRDWYEVYRKVINLKIPEPNLSFRDWIGENKRTIHYYLITGVVLWLIFWSGVPWFNDPIVFRFSRIVIAIVFYSVITSRIPLLENIKSSYPEFLNRKYKHKRAAWYAITGYVLLLAGIVGIFWSSLPGFGDPVVIIFNMVAGTVALYTVFVSRISTREIGFKAFRYINLIIALYIFIFGTNFAVHAPLFLVLVIIAINYGRLATVTYSRVYGPLFLICSIATLVTKMGLPLIYIIGLTLIAVFGILHLWIGYAKDYEEFVGSQQHLRFGKIISEAINNHHNIDLKPIFGALLSKTGGAVGIGPTWPISTNTLLFVEDGKISVPEAVELIESINIDEPSNGANDAGQNDNEIVIHLYIE